MEDFSLMPGTEMLARRAAAEDAVASVIGQLVFAYSKFNSALHYCVAWHNDGNNLDNYGDHAESFSVADLINKIEIQAKSRYGNQSDAYKLFSAWAKKAHATRELRNLIMHSRWGIEAYGRHAIAISTPPFVEPQREHIISIDALVAACNECNDLITELGKLRKKYPQ